MYSKRTGFLQIFFKFRLKYDCVFRSSALLLLKGQEAIKSVLKLLYLTTCTMNETVMNNLRSFQQFSDFACPLDRDNNLSSRSS